MSASQERWNELTVPLPMQDTCMTASLKEVTGSFSSSTSQSSEFDSGNKRAYNRRLPVDNSCFPSVNTLSSPSVVSSYRLSTPPFITVPVSSDVRWRASLVSVSDGEVPFGDIPVQLEVPNVCIEKLASPTLRHMFDHSHWMHGVRHGCLRVSPRLGVVTVADANVSLDIGRSAITVLRFRYSGRLKPKSLAKGNLSRWPVNGGRVRVALDLQWLHGWGSQGESWSSCERHDVFAERFDLEWNGGFKDRHSATDNETMRQGPSQTGWRVMEASGSVAATLDWSADEADLIGGCIGGGSELCVAVCAVARAANGPVSSQRRTEDNIVSVGRALLVDCGAQSAQSPDVTPGGSLRMRQMETGDGGDGAASLTGSGSRPGNGVAFPTQRRDMMVDKGSDGRLLGVDDDDDEPVEGKSKASSITSGRLVDASSKPNGVSGTPPSQMSDHPMLPLPSPLGLYGVAPVHSERHALSMGVTSRLGSAQQQQQQGHVSSRSSSSNVASPAVGSSEASLPVGIDPQTPYLPNTQGQQPTSSPEMTTSHFQPSVVPPPPMHPTASVADGGCLLPSPLGVRPYFAQSAHLRIGHGPSEAAALSLRPPGTVGETPSTSRRGSFQAGSTGASQQAASAPQEGVQTGWNGSRQQPYNAQAGGGGVLSRAALALERLSPACSSPRSSSSSITTLSPTSALTTCVPPVQLVGRSGRGGAAGLATQRQQPYVAGPSSQTSRGALSDVRQLPSSSTSGNLAMRLREAGGDTGGPFEGASRRGRGRGLADMMMNRGRMPAVLNNHDMTSVVTARSPAKASGRGVGFASTDLYGPHGRGDRRPHVRPIVDNRVGQDTSTSSESMRPVLSSLAHDARLSPSTRHADSPMTGYSLPAPAPSPPQSYSAQQQQSVAYVPQQSRSALQKSHTDRCADAGPLNDSHSHSHQTHDSPPTRSTGRGLLPSPQLTQSSPMHPIGFQTCRFPNTKRSYPLPDAFAARRRGSVGENERRLCDGRQGLYPAYVGHATPPCSHPTTPSHESSRGGSGYAPLLPNWHDTSDVYQYRHHNHLTPLAFPSTSHVGSNVSGTSVRLPRKREGEGRPPPPPSDATGVHVQLHKVASTSLLHCTGGHSTQPPVMSVDEVHVPMSRSLPYLHAPHVACPVSEMHVACPSSVGDVGHPVGGWGHPFASLENCLADTTCVTQASSRRACDKQEMGYYVSGGESSTAGEQQRHTSMAVGLQGGPGGGTGARSGLDSLRGTMPSVSQGAMLHMRPEKNMETFVMCTTPHAKCFAQSEEVANPDADADGFYSCEEDESDDDGSSLRVRVPHGLDANPVGRAAASAGSTTTTTGRSRGASGRSKAAQAPCRRSNVTTSVGVVSYSLAALWTSLMEASVFGLEVPFVGLDCQPFNVTYVPYLSALQLYDARAPPDSPPVYEYFEHQPPHVRRPLALQIRLLVDSYRRRRRTCRSTTDSDTKIESCPGAVSRVVGCDVVGDDAGLASSPNHNKTPGLREKALFSSAASTNNKGMQDAVDKNGGSSPQRHQRRGSEWLEANSDELSPSSWFSALWQPVQRDGLDRSGCAAFLMYYKFQTLDSPLLEADDTRPIDVVDGVDTNANTKAKACCAVRVVQLSRFGMVPYRVDPKVWTFDTTGGAADVKGDGLVTFRVFKENLERWLGHMKVTHPDFEFLKSRMQQLMRL